ncbi:2507_t:CDS:2 [Entrophospora sp. SA101]|nr:4268_t:CDS:2 [Entrophospora sp. SA101]CAJ0640905.1 2507_t:CDS:2 [Entrophospora sp. SA101]CAJ0824507.1 7156_t:CDS:2 [Entrophospora sp. SA101]CAJ0907503.1 14502_t:CDS:2 [Entrophospora sp. SA101]
MVWLSSEEVKSLFKWLDPNRKAPSGRILNDASFKHNHWIEQQASNIGHNLDNLDIWTDLPTLDQDDWEVKNPKTNGTVKQKNAYQSLNVACKELREM